MAASVASAAPQAFSHGHHIFVYSNIRTNQVVYSLTRSLKNNLSLKQLPFLGKKTVPAALRKDLWQPLCFLEFPSPTLGLAAYHKLREYRRLHELSYPLSAVTETEGPFKGQLLPKKKRGKVLMNQKANSVADMAAVLLLQSKKPSAEELKKADRKVRKDGRPLAKRGLGSQASAEVYTARGSVEGVRIRWANILDAEYAETWPAAVIHDGLEKHRYTAAWPPAPPLVANDEEILEEIRREEANEPQGPENTEVKAEENVVGTDGEDPSKRAAEKLPMAALPDTPRPTVTA
ncbi:hypothetical protein MMC30_007777 [Trapelia coarctata]|nr:hypothetical protein [Trapelia coarctata]